MKEQTAMMELIEKLKNDIKEMNEDGSYSEDFIDATYCAIFEAEQLLEVEQEQIYDSYVAGWNDDTDLDDDELMPEKDSPYYKYYQDTYQTDWEEERNLVKERRKKLLIEMMRDDEELGLYDNEAKDL
jgi:hypothetical protein